MVYIDGSNDSYGVVEYVRSMFYISNNYSCIIYGVNENSETYYIIEFKKCDYTNFFYNPISYELTVSKEVYYLFYYKMLEKFGNIIKKSYELNNNSFAFILKPDRLIKLNRLLHE